MPADHGLRPDDLQSVQNARCQPIQPGKYQTVEAGEAQSLRRFTPQHVELITKRQDLCLQRRSRSEQSDQRQPNQDASISHQPRASPNSTPLASRIEFPTMTGTTLTSKCSSRDARPGSVQSRAPRSSTAIQALREASLNPFQNIYDAHQAYFGTGVTRGYECRVEQLDRIGCFPRTKRSGGCGLQDREPGRRRSLPRSLHEDHA